MDKKFYITTPIYYVNMDPHLGGAYATVAADVLARYHRAKGEQVFFLTGTDEHGAKIVEAAAKNNKTPKEFADQIAAKYQLLWDELQISNDNFIRTTDPQHEKIVAAIVQRLYDKGFIYKGPYSGLYCVGCESYYTEKELVDGKCPYHQTAPIQLSEECYFFKLSGFQEPLMKLIDAGDWVIEPKKRRNEVLGFLKTEKLKDLAISRAKAKMNWGITLPWDKNYVLYVWIDALLNYLTGLGWSAQRASPRIDADTITQINADQDADKRGYVGVNPRGNQRESANSISVNLGSDLCESAFRKWWPPDVQLLGKDILRFHAVVWPAVLLALEIPLPKKLFITGFFTINGQKMSKSLGNVIDPHEVIKIFGSDAARYLLLSLFPFGQDGDVSMEKFYDKYSANLASGLGNLVSRIITLAQKQDAVYEFSENESFQAKTSETWAGYERALDALALEQALAIIQGLSSFCDKYIEETKPWQLLKTDPDPSAGLGSTLSRAERVALFRKVMYNLLESLRHLAWLISPFMPEVSEKILAALGLFTESKKDLSLVKDWGAVNHYQVKSVEPLFPRIESHKPQN